MLHCRRSALIAAVLASIACAPSRPPWADGATVHTQMPRDAGPQDLGNVPARILALHNRERLAVGAPALGWDPALAASAAAYAPDLARLSRLEHSPRETRVGQGENLWRGTRGAYSIEEIVGSWAAERRLFRPGTFPNVSETGQWSDVSHYTQMIWPTTSRVGCAFHQSAQYDFLICRYSPSGNVNGRRVP